MSLTSLHFHFIASSARSLLYRQTVHPLHALHHQTALIRKGTQPPTPSLEDVTEQKDLIQAYPVKAILCFTRKETDSPMLRKAQNSARLRAVPDLRRLALHLSIQCCSQWHHIKWEAISPCWFPPLSLVRHSPLQQPFFHIASFIVGTAPGFHSACGFSTQPPNTCQT